MTANELYDQVQGQLGECDIAKRFAVTDRERRTIANTIAQLAIVGAVASEETDPDVMIGLIVVHCRISGIFERFVRPILDRGRL